jgi:hypothetical protein
VSDSRADYEKKFGITKAPPDPETLAIFEARRNCYAEPRRRLDRAKYMFGELCDRATNTTGPGFLRKGSVVVPDSELARIFGVWESTIYNWKRQLEAAGYIWTSKQWRSDRWPITVYHLACIHPRQNERTQNPDGTSNAGRRSVPGKPGEVTPTGKTWSAGARKPGQRSLPLATPLVPPVPWNTSPPVPIKLENMAIVAAIQSPHRLTATTGTGCEPQPAPAVSHNGHRLTATTGTGSQPHGVVAHSHNGDGLPATNGKGLRRVSESVLGSVESFKAVNRLENRAVASGGKRKRPEGEDEFMKLCTSVFGEAEMRKNGGLWRTIYGQNAKKALACVRETKEVKASRPATIRKGPAAFAMDLWKNDRLNYDTTPTAPPAKPKQAAKPSTAALPPVKPLTAEDVERGKPLLKALREAVAR